MLIREETSLNGLVKRENRDNDEWEGCLIFPDYNLEGSTTEPTQAKNTDRWEGRWSENKTRGLTLIRLNGWKIDKKEQGGEFRRT